MKWQRLDKESLDDLKEAEHAILFYGSTETPLKSYFTDLIAWNQFSNDMSKRWYSYTNNNNPYNDNSLLSKFSHFCLIDQPERSKREDSPLLENDGRIKILCQRLNCGATLLIHEYSKDKSIHFCPSCWIQLYSLRNIITENAIRNKKEPMSVPNLDKIIIDQFIKYGEMRCSEPDGNTGK